VTVGGRFWPTRELGTRESWPKISSAYRLEAVISLAEGLRAANDPQQQLCLVCKEVAPASKHQAPVAAVCREDRLERWDVCRLVRDENITPCLNPIEVSGENSRPFRGIEHVQGSIDQEHAIHSCRLEGSNVADNTLDIQALGLDIRKQVTNSRWRLIDTDHRMALHGNEQRVTTLAASDVKHP
jgi:hypothetical protein